MDIQNKMQREIKFRAWNPETKTMILDVQNMYDGIGDYFDSKGNEIDVYDHLKTSSFGDILESQENGIVVMQYTGLKDKNGKEIYEGDIVGKKWIQKSIDKDGEHFAEKISGIELVEYIKSGFSPFAYDHFGDEGYSLDECEVIGNIYENPNLLK